MRHRFTDRGILRFVFTILIFVSSVAGLVAPLVVRADLLEEPCATSIKSFAQIVRASSTVDKQLAKEILDVANGTRRIVGRVAAGIPEGHAVTVSMGEQVQRGSKTYAVIHRSVQKVDATSKDSANSTGLASAIAIVENGKLKTIHLERGARVETAADMIAKEKELLQATGLTPEKISEHVNEFTQAKFGTGELNLPGRTTVTKSEAPLFNVLRISKLDKDTWIVRARTSLDFAAVGQTSRPGDPGSIAIGVTAIINKNGDIAVLADQSRQQLQAQGLKMSTVLDGGMPVQDLARAQERLGFHIAAVHDRSDGLQTGDFGSYWPANYRVTVAFEKDLPIKKSKESVRKTETVFVEGTYSSRWGLIMPTDLPRIYKLRRPDAARKNILEIKRERDEKNAARLAKPAAPNPGSDPSNGNASQPAAWWNVLEAPDAREN